MFSQPYLYRIGAFLITVLLCSSNAHAWNFNWNTLGWSPDGSLSQSYPNVNGSSIDVTVNVTGNTNRFTASTPLIDSSNRLESYPDYPNKSESISFTFTFSQPVTVSGFPIWDIDGTSWADKVTITGLVENGATVDPDNVSFGSNINQVSLAEYESLGTSLGDTDTRGRVTFSFSDQPVKSFTIVHSPGSLAPANPSSQAIWMDNFTFAKVKDYAYSDQCSPIFTDISGTGTALGLSDDDEDDVTLPFSFLFYDTLSTAVRIGSNGGIIFGPTSGTLEYTNTDIPAASPAPAILPFWDDLNPGSSGGGDVYYQTRGTAPNREFVVQWDNVPHYRNVGSATIQAILFEGSNNIFFVYRDVDFGNSSYDNGAGATIGLNKDGTTSHKYSFNTASLSGVDGICFFSPDDYGDAPSSYGTPYHTLDSTLYLGAAADAPDAEIGEQDSTGANGDNNDGTDDENGVSFRSPAGTNHSIYADVTVHNGTGGTVKVCGWLDVPSGSAVDGAFSAADGSCQSTSSVDTTLTFQWSALPSDRQYTTYARFRVSSNSLTTSLASGSASDGEVEDYQVVFDFTPTAVTIGKVELQATWLTDFLDELDTGQMDRAVLLALLQAWDPDAAAALTGADREEILAALHNYLDPDGDNQVAVLAWDTLEERGTIGFYVDRRQENDAWTRINNNMLPGLINAPMGGEYRLADPGVTDGTYQYRLIEQEARGTTRSYGPFEVELP